MTDSEIIKALECCSDAKAECSSCPLYHMKYACCTGCVGCGPLLIYNALDLIKRLKEEIGKAKSEAVDEFARRLIEEINAINYKEYNNYLDTFNTIERIAEEMECE